MFIFIRAARAFSRLMELIGVLRDVELCFSAYIELTRRLPWARLIRLTCVSV